MVGKRHLAAPALWLAVLAVSWALYQHEDSLRHFLWHMGYGASAGLMAAAAWTLATGPIRRHRSLWPLAGYLYMAIPDLLWLAPTLVGGDPYPHQPWMDVFLGHYSLDLWPLATPMLVPTVAASLVAYVWADRRRRTQGTRG